MTNITAIVVTYNRKELLENCIIALKKQTKKIERILIIDNKSTDGTANYLKDKGLLDADNIELITLSENTGGAGGFSAGLAHAVKLGADWVWMMDDDAEPHIDALENLTNRTLLPENLYGSVAIFNEKLSWPMLPKGGKPQDIIYYQDKLPDAVDVQFIPFLGILISADMVNRIGLPDAGFFLAADDVEYCLRARNAGAEIILVGNSRINHPASERYRLWLPGRDFFSLRLPPWKRYYDVRNRLFIARKYYGAALWYSTIPGSLLRLIATLWHENHRWQQIKAFYAGMVDGLLGRKGRRHEHWGIKP